MVKVDLRARKGLISVDDLSDHLGISINTIYSWVNQRKIPYIKVGRLLKFDFDDIQEWIQNKKVGILEL